MSVTCMIALLELAGGKEVEGVGRNIQNKSLTSENYLTFLKVRKKARIKNQYNQVPHLTQDTTWESDKLQENITY